MIYRLAKSAAKKLVPSVQLEACPLTASSNFGTLDILVMKRDLT